ncbi:hypothetical protein [Planotetraspora sp. GP83]|uniref:hypothetical protein n=1 Tax=Planotetraspora sp. GP83 TaxID=3156264 RepID=UPI0035185967
MRPADPDDIDGRFEALVAQFDEDEIRRLGVEAARLKRRGGARDKAPIVVLTLCGLVVAAGLLISMRPDVLDGFVDTGEPVAKHRMAPAFARPGPALTPAGEADPPVVQPTVQPAWDPFAGSKAAQYADGEKGLVMPAAKALGGLTGKQAEAALKRVRKMLAAAYLDLDTVRGKKPAAFIKLLEPEQRKWFLQHFGKGENGGTRSWVFSLQPGAAEPASDVIKVDGETTISRRRDGDGRKGITIKVDYLFVYAVNRPGDRGTTMRVVSHRKVKIAAYRQNGKTTVWVDHIWSGNAGGGCGFDDGFVHPDFPEQPSKVKPSGPPVDPYDRRHDDLDHPGCRATTGT